MPDPLPSSVHPDFRSLVGAWRSRETIASTPWDPGGEAVGEYENVLGLDGKVVIQRYTQLRAGRVALRGHGVFWWSAPTAEVVLHWWDSWADSPREFRGTSDGRQLTLVSAAARGHARATWTFSDGAPAAYTLEVSADGAEWQPYLRAAITRA